MKQILFIEDDLSLIHGLSYALKKENYSVDVARTKFESEKFWKQKNYDVIILDVSLPDGSGFDICKDIRKNSTTPIVFLTASDEETDVIMGLDLGADDYITKPFKLAIFLSRINALLRRSDNFSESNLELASNEIRIDLLKREVYRSEEQIFLTANEYKLLCLLIENSDIVLSPKQILSKLWDSDENYVDSNTLTVYIRRLRTKIEENPSEPNRIINVRGMGYKWNSKV